MLFSRFFKPTLYSASLTVCINWVTSSTNIIKYVAKWYVRKRIDHYCSVVREKFSHTRSVFCCFYPSHTPTAALGKDNKTKLCSGPASPVHIFNVWTIIMQNSKWVWSGNTTITNRRQPRGTARKSRSTITRHQEDKLNKATSYLFPIKMIAILE